MRYPSFRIVVFCKAPEPGQVKTRLASSVGEAEACRVHEALATRMISEAVASNLAPVELWCSPSTDHPFFERFDVPRYLQQGADLGERMHCAIDGASGRADAVVLVGTDCPPIDRDYLDLALSSLESADAVLGPAEDGGYGLIGLRRPRLSLFSDMAWSTASVAAITVERFEQASLRYCCLPTIWDVDRPEDLRRWRELSRPARDC